MKKWISAVLLAVLLCALHMPAQASQMLNVYMDKQALLAHDPSQADIRVRPENMVRVTRHSLWPWDEEGTHWSLFVEIENTSDEKIVIDETWLVACKANRDEIATADYAFLAADNVLDPGERTVFYAGVEEWMMPTDYHDVTGFEAVEGLSAFADKICRAEILRVRLETRGRKSAANWPQAAIDAETWIEDGKLRFEMKNDSQQVFAFHTLGVIVSDAEGRIIDALRSSYARGAVAQPGETIAFEKELQPYISNEMAEGARLDVFAYLMPETTLQINAR